MYKYDLMYKVTIITSVYKSSQHLSGFLENITQQSAFDKCELFLMNANSPDTEIEDRIISNYLSDYKNDPLVEHFSKQTNIPLIKLPKIKI